MTYWLKFIGVLWFLLVVKGNLQMAMGQYEPISTQYMINPMLINPAYAGMHNAIAIDVMARRQWLGIEGAPQSQSFSIHSPLNDSYMSLGGFLVKDQAGPVDQIRSSVCYSYLVKFKKPVILSLGLNAGVTATTIGLGQMELNHPTDPFLDQSTRSFVKPDFGFGSYLYTPVAYIGFSVPHLLEPEYSDEEKSIMLFKSIRTMYLSGGYSLKLDKKWSFKPSFLLRYANGMPVSADVNAAIAHKKGMWTGLSYRLNKSVAAFVNLQISNSLSVCYSYETGLKMISYYNKGSHEISLTYDIYQFYRRTKHRKFPKKGADEPDEGVKSMRYF